jgi:hypothetical protein
MKKISLVLKTLIFLPFLGLSLFFLYGSVRTVQQQARAADFLAVPAEVVESRVQYIRTVSRRRWEVRIVYTYTVDGTRYQSSRLGFDTRPRIEGYEGTEASYAEAFPVGKQITAYYDPEEPATAVLTRRQDRSPLRFFIPLGLLGFFSLLIFGPLLLEFED